MDTPQRDLLVRLIQTLRDDIQAHKRTAKPFSDQGGFDQYVKTTHINLGPLLYAMNNSNEAAMFEVVEKLDGYLWRMDNQLHLKIDDFVVSYPLAKKD